MYLAVRDMQSSTPTKAMPLMVESRNCNSLPVEYIRYCIVKQTVATQIVYNKYQT